MVGAMPVNIMPKFYNGAIDSHNAVDDNELSVFVGSRVKCNDDFGTVKYIGEVQGYKGIWYGIEWDDASRGKHDGSVDDLQYFKTSKPCAGSFVRPNKISPFTTCAEAIKRYYGDCEDEMVAIHQKTAINEWKREMKAPFIEMVGFEKIHQKQKLDRLREVCVHDQNICKAGNIADLCPNVTSLDVSQNLFSNWREIIQLSAQLPNLKELDVNKNRMVIDIPEDILQTLSIHFSSLEKINISMCDYDWKAILTLSNLWPNITEIVAAFNRINRITSPQKIFDNLTTLKLDGNPIVKWDEIMNLGHLKKLTCLSLNDCFIQKIRFDVIDEKVDSFSDLEVLFLNRNRIDDWQSLSELNKLKSLKKLYFLKNPIQETEDYDTGSALIVAKIGNLQYLNGTEISREGRRGAEYDYMKRYGGEWKLAQKCLDTMKQFDAQHCRFQTLIDKYGIPDDSLLIKQQKTSTINSQLMEIKLQGENEKSVMKRIPPTMSVQKLATLAQKFFPKTKKNGVLKMYCMDQQNGAKILLDNVMKDLKYYSITHGDVIQIRWQ